MGPADHSSWNAVRVASWAITACGVAYLMGPQFISQFRPPENRFLDFSQEWLSAKNYWSGVPVYADQTEALLRHTGVSPDKLEEILPRNAHPPAAVVVTLPSAALGYGAAHLVWNLLTLPLFLLSVGLIVRDLKIPVQLWSLLPAIVLLLLCGPLYYHLLLGQFNFPVLFLMTVAWVADRRERPGWAGAALGAAACLKLYPLFVFVYFLFAGRRLALITGAMAFLIGNGIALMILGVHEFETYIRDVLPSLSHYQSSSRNVSLNGLWVRLFDPHPGEGIVPLMPSPVLGQALTLTSRFLIVAIVARASWLARSVESRDRAFAAAIVGMILVAPFSWTHYFTLLPLPLGLVWTRIPSGWQRWLFGAILVIIWIPENLFVSLMEPLLAVGSSDRTDEPFPPLFSLICFPIPTYALLVLFVLVLRTPSHIAQVGGPADNNSAPERDPA
ncbi:hypothetical protein FTUN_3692 [Frigoriglobus tundricola]|uniref:DUF2029 domain-containing protein n=2 Tax=Frigoriglobus tundricola TaxID=2774151 RepID=A0A6M5YRY9_9BACT|nr:hypothetical protein FTUN_3692 [Frigoriglobus tundricola]